MSRAFELQTNRSGKCLKAELKLARASRVPDKVANAMPTLGVCYDRLVFLPLYDGEWLSGLLLTPTSCK